MGLCIICLEYCNLSLNMPCVVHALSNMVFRSKGLACCENPLDCFMITSYIHVGTLGCGKLICTCTCTCSLDPSGHWCWI